jgi:hypothetical protein
VTPGDRKPGKTGAASKRGKAVNIYLHEADQMRIRDLAAYLANEGLRCERLPNHQGRTFAGGAG